MYSKKQVKILLKKLATILEDKAELRMHEEVGSGNIFTDKPGYCEFLTNFDSDKWIKEVLRDISFLKKQFNKLKK